MELLSKNIDKKIEKIIINSKKTIFPGIYENIPHFVDKKKPTLIMLVGPTGVGKSTFIKYLIENSFQKVITATTRSKRNDENSNDYIWITEKKKPDETLEEYAKRLKSKYDFVEYNVFANNIYGTPRKSLQNALKKGKAVIGIENNGAKQIKEQFESLANVLIFFILPDNFEQIKSRVSGSRNDVGQRLLIAKKEVAESPNIANYYIHNTELQIYSTPSTKPLDNLTQNFLNFLNHILD